MDHAVDASVLQASSLSQGSTELPASAIGKVIVWLDLYLADGTRKLALDAGFAMWTFYEQFGESNYGLLVLQAKIDQQCLRLVPVSQSVSGAVMLDGDWQHLDEHRRWVLGIVQRHAAEISIANATYEPWHTKPPSRDLAGVKIEQILHEWLHEQVTARQIAENTDSQKQYHLPPKQLQGTLAAARRVGVGTNDRMAWEDDERRYEFDRQHNTVEVWSLATGKWLHEARLDGTVLKTEGGEGRYWGRT